MTVPEADPSRLDDPEALEVADPAEVLRQVATAAAQVREAQLLAAEAGIERVADGGRPRAIVVAGSGEAGTAGDVLAAVCGPGCRVPISTVRGHRLPGWAGAADLVVALSASGAEEETLGVAAEAVRRGCRLLCVGAAGSALSEIAVQSASTFVPVASQGKPWSSLWALSVPPLLAVRALGLADVTAELLESAAVRLEEASHQCRPASDVFVNPGKQAALDLAGSIPVIWGTSPLTGVVAQRFAAQLAVHAKYPAISGELPEVHHNQVMTFDGVFASSRGTDDDIFRDRVDEPDRMRLRLVLIRDTEEHPQVTRRREASAELAGERGVAVTELSAREGHPLERLAGLIAHTDYASVYLALAIGMDPAPGTAVHELRARMT